MSIKWLGVNTQPRPCPWILSRTAFSIDCGRLAIEFRNKQWHEFVSNERAGLDRLAACAFAQKVIAARSLKRAQAAKGYDFFFRVCRYATSPSTSSFPSLNSFITGLRVAPAFSVIPLESTIH